MLPEMGGDMMNGRRRNKLIELRGQRTRQEVAKALGITPQMLGMIERGQRYGSPTLMKRIADYYGVSIEEIFFEENGNISFLV